MGGGDLNLKKSWHPQTLRNQEKVWKAEQADLKEKQKLNELEKEIKEERNREDLKKLGQSSGVLNTENPKLEWMYKGPSDLLNREDYLLGRAIDKNFEQLDAAEKAEKEKQLVGVTVPKNHVEHECIPFSIRQYKSAQNSEQVDLQRKIMEDPLMLIKQKEMESRRKILENPVKLKELHRLLKMESINRKNKKKSKKEMKKKTKKEHKKSKSEYKSSDSTTDDEELDRMLTKQYMKVQNVFQKEEKSANLDFNKMVNLKYEKLSKELDKLLKSEKRHQKSFRDSNSSSDVSSSSSDRNKKYKHKKEYHSSSKSKQKEAQPRSQNNTRNRKRRKSDSSDESNSSCDEAELDNLLTKQYMKVQGVLQKDRSSATLENDKQNNLNYETLSKELDKIVKSERNQQQKIRSNSTSSDSSRQSLKRGRHEHSKSNRRFNRERSRSPNRHHTNNKESKKSRSRSRSKDRGSRLYNKGDRGRYNSTSFDRKKFENRKTSTKTSSGHGDTSPSYQRSHSFKQNSSKEVKKLSEQEKEKRRREMMENALWRDEERSKKVTKYREEYDKEKEIFESSEFDKTFINKELHKAMSHQKSVESRIKSNINNIQRSSRAMDTNFAKR